MHNYLKTSLFLFFTVFILSFTSNINSNSFHFKQQKNDTITWKMLSEIKFIKKKHPSYGSIDFPVVNEKVK